MTKSRYIGDNLSEAVTWAQDLLRTARPIAEQTVMSAISDHKIIWNEGIYLLEDDEEIERRAKTTVMATKKTFNAAKKWSRVQFRSSKHSATRAQKNSGKNSLASVHKQAASKFSNLAEDMLAGKTAPAALPSGSDIEQDI